jgi:hypothetical protein
MTYLELKMLGLEKNRSHEDVVEAIERAYIVCISEAYDVISTNMKNVMQSSGYTEDEIDKVDKLFIPAIGKLYNACKE